MNTSYNPKTLFIVGCPRSGTTLLQEMLNAHHEIVLGPELFFIRMLYLNRKKFGDLSIRENRGLVGETIISLNNFTEFGFDQKDFMDWIQNNNVDYGDIYRKILEQLDKKNKVKYIGEKTPNNALYIKKIINLIPDAQFIYIIRDPRAVVSSWSKVPWSTGTIVGDATIWNRYIKAYHRLPDDIKTKIYLVRFEDLVNDTVRELKKITGFLGIQYTDSMLSYYNNKKMSFSSSEEPWKKNVKEPIKKERINIWKEQLSKADIIRVEGVCRKFMKIYNYNLHYSRLNTLRYIHEYIVYPYWTFAKRKMIKLFVCG